ncbi:MAG: dihydroneopterin aldolase [Actinomycetota bacterium]
MPQVIRIRGIRAEGRHGASAGERDEAQPFVVDLDVEVEVAGDDLESTGDYREVVAAVRRVVEGEPVTLIETLAGRIAAAALVVSGVRTCRAVVHKPRAAERLGVADVSAEATSG